MCFNNITKTAGKYQSTAPVAPWIAVCPPIYEELYIIIGKIFDIT